MLAATGAAAPFRKGSRRGCSPGLRAVVSAECSNANRCRDRSDLSRGDSSLSMSGIIFNATG